MSDEIPQWAFDRARAIIGYDRNAYEGIAFDAFTRYIMQHEKPPVDKDVLVVRAVLASQWESQASEDILAGREDNASYFQDALAAYRKHKQ